MKMIRTLFITLFFCSLFGGACGIASAAEEIPSTNDVTATENLPATHEEALLTLINQARQNPLAVAASMGMNTEKILTDLPSLGTILKEGLPTVTFDGKLFEAARAHTQDMLTNGYYSHHSLDGLGYEARIQKIGYPAVVSGESLGMLVFADFIEPGDAVKYIFEYMLRDELDPLRTEKRNIFDPLLKEAGISIDTGVFSLGGIPWNVYLVTCDFGSVISGPEKKLFDSINQARQKPLEVATSLGMDQEQILTDFPEWYDLLTQGLPALTFNTKLAAAARAHAADMLANGYFSKNSLDGRTYEDRIRGTGYNLLDAGETMIQICLDDDFFTDMSDGQMEEAVASVFKNIFARALRPKSTDEKNIFNVTMKDIGIGIAMGTSDKLGGICGNNVLLMVADFGLSAE